MADERKIWIGRDGQRFGPYDEASVREWISLGKVPATSLGWCEGMAQWLPLYEILGIPVPPPMVGGAAPALHSELPAPPDLHWAIIFVVDLLAGGLMGIVWQFVQASWVKKIDPSSRATMWLVISVCLLPLTWIVMLGVVLNQSYNATRPDLGAVAGVMAYFGFFFLFGLAMVVCRYIAMFSMARSMREKLPAYGLVPEIGGVTLFFFTHYYLQAQMTWVARWRRTGQSTPPAQKAIFWVVFGVWAGLMVLFLMLVWAAMFASYHSG